MLIHAMRSLAHLCGSGISADSGKYHDQNGDESLFHQTPDDLSLFQDDTIDQRHAFLSCHYPDYALESRCDHQTATLKACNHLRLSEGVGDVIPQILCPHISLYNVLIDEKNTRHGYKSMLNWMQSFGEVKRIGVECTGTYGAGLGV